MPLLASRHHVFYITKKQKNSIFRLKKKLTGGGEEHYSTIFTRAKKFPVAFEYAFYTVPSKRYNSVLLLSFLYTGRHSYVFSDFKDIPRKSQKIFRDAKGSKP